MMPATTVQYHGSGHRMILSLQNNEKVFESDKQQKLNLQKQENSIIDDANNLCNKQIKYFIKFHFPFIFSLL
jgi:hypothetical protein